MPDRSDDQQAPAVEFKHGSSMGWVKHRCRCQECRAWHAAAARETRRKPVPQGAPHGSYSTYTNYGCRCQECRGANSARQAARRAARRAALAETQGAPDENPPAPLPTGRAGGFSS